MRALLVGSTGGLLLLLLLCCGTTPVPAADGADRLEEILSVMRDRQEQVRTFVAEWIEAPGADDGRQRERTIRLTVGSEGQFLLESSPTGERTAGQAGAMKSSFDGRRNRQFTEAVGKDDWPRGIVWDDAKYDELSGAQIRIWLLHLRPFFQPLPDLGNGQLRITEQDVLLDGHRCIVVEKPGHDSDSYVERYWIDIDRACILRSEQRSKEGGRLLFERTARYRQDDGLGWLPESWESRFGNGSNALRARLVRFERNRELPGDTFAFEFPVGTVVFDRDRGLRHLVLADGKTRDITPEESASGFDYRALREMSPSELAPRFDARQEEWTPSTIVLLAANVLVLVAGATFWCLRRGE
ncbi:hypothetical protein Mal4_26750 [Maioricimonas rarisocia]|uniref:DUF1583 domain-containing protein n=1 Tax=Maioricimonas rarisocia TaxID=2528026 RepID=A0A517Z792_9PLAN|nr:hypothetical protein [Maioricimonas rarisocia]QDU38348.1 hypothetical protein Mal4_26750 [Maioricimonas rarisocia]